MRPLSAQLRGAPHRSTLLRLAPLHPVPLSGAAHRSALLRLAALCAALYLTIHNAAFSYSVPGSIQDYNVKGVGEGPGLFPSLINNIIMPRDGLASSG